MPSIARVPRIHTITVDPIMTRLRTERPRFDIRQGQRCFSPSRTARPWASPSLLHNGYRSLLYPGVNKLGLHADHPAPPVPRLNSCGTILLPYIFMMCLIKTRNIFTLREIHKHVGHIFYLLRSNTASHVYTLKSTIIMLTVMKFLKNGSHKNVYIINTYH